MKYLKPTGRIKWYCIGSNRTLEGEETQEKPIIDATLRDLSPYPSCDATVF